MARRGKVNYNNEFKVPNEKADEIWKLSNKELVNRVSLEYANWTATEEQKKNDTTITALKNQIKELQDAMKEDPAYLEAKEEFDRKKDELESEELASYKEQLKLENKTYQEDIGLYKGCFKLAMEELSTRKQKGLLNLDGV